VADKDETRLSFPPPCMAMASALAVLSPIDWQAVRVPMILVVADNRKSSGFVASYYVDNQSNLLKY
jgi:hypothetical protein